MEIISKTIEKTKVSKEGLLEDMNGDDITYFKYIIRYYAYHISESRMKFVCIFKTHSTDNHRDFLLESTVVNVQYGTFNGNKILTLSNFSSPNICSLISKKYI